MTTRGAWPRLLAPGKSVTFSVVDRATQARSATWRVFTGKRVDDVYLLELVTGPQWKVSHHNDGGVWRIAMTKEGAAAVGTARAVADHWTRPGPVDGWSEGVGVLVPRAYLRPEASPLGSRTVVVPSEPSHDAISVHLAFGELGANSIGFGAAFPIAVLGRIGGGAVYVFAQATHLTPKAIDGLEEMCRLARAERDATGDTYSTERFVGVSRAGEQRILSDLTLAAAD